MNETRVNLISGVEAAWSKFMAFLPNFLIFLAILIVGYFFARLCEKLFNRLLDRLHFDRAVDRGGVKRVLERSGYDANGLLAKLLFYAIFLLVLQFAFGVFGTNPVSTLLDRIIAYIPHIFVAVVIVILASAIARAVGEIVRVSLGGFRYGGFLATVASVAILVIGVFAALDQLQIAPAVVNGLFYALLAIIVGSAIISIGGGGIAPMRAQWERMIGRIEREAPQIAATARSTAASAEANRIGVEAERRTVTPNQ